MAKQEIENTISKKNVELLKSKIKKNSNALKKDIIIKRRCEFNQ